ncbi:MAG: hypothetical protein ACI8S3_001352 [Alphaproteobacteria bacterium]|jgi:hypothetical protein
MKTINLRSTQKPAGLLVVSALALAIAATAPSGAMAAAEKWAPVASEKLMQLPGDFLRKAVDNDFARSGLAQELVSLDEQVVFKRSTLADLQRAIERADDADIRLDLQHQFLNEKRNYIELMRENQDIRRKRAATKVKLYERLLDNLNRQRRATTPEKAAFIAKQTAARERFKASASQIDAQLLTSSAASESRYSREYAKNLSAVQELVAAINAHPMNAAPALDGQPVTRGEYLRQLIAENQGDLAVVDQERAILGHMAKLVSLDALALSEGIDSDAYAEIDIDATEEGPNQVTSAVEFFTTR